MSTVLAVAQQGEAILNLIASPVSPQEFGSNWLNELGLALQSTMLARHGVGIAAPQVYVSKRVILVASRPNPRYPNAPEMQPTLMINPEIIRFSMQTELAEEGCLSVADTRAQVSRASEIDVRYYSQTGAEVIQTLSGFPARIVQHEIDHLNGILFVEHIPENTYLEQSQV